MSTNNVYKFCQQIMPTSNVNKQCKKIMPTNNAKKLKRFQEAPLTLKNPHLHVYLSFSMSPRRGQEGRKNLERKQDAEP